MISEDELPDMPGAPVYGDDGEKVGKVGHVYLDELTGKGEWMTVASGLFGTSQTFIPLASASLVEGEVRLPFDSAKIKDAPRVSADDYLSPMDEDTLYRYYEMQDARPQPDDADGLPRDFAGDPVLPAGAGRGPRGADPAVATDPATDLSSDREAGAATGEEAAQERKGHRKYVISEQKKITVTISPEEIKIEEDVRVEREPLAAGEDVAPEIIAAELREFAGTSPMPVADAVETLERVLRSAEIVAQQAPPAADEPGP